MNYSNRLFQDVDGPEAGVEEPVKAATPAPALDTTTLLNNDEESFALAPVDTTVLKGMSLFKRLQRF